MKGLRIALIAGAPAVRHARQLMLRGEGFDVRAYGSAAPLLADPLALASSCIVAEVAMPEIAGVALVQAMRGQGLQGAAILLAGVVSPALAALATEQDFTVMVPTELADGLLLAGIRTAIAEHSR
ncbi:histidine kinase [Sphingomonas sp. PAMC 26621]|uniref:histidine kinase n=1 Tax=Sphingomonas sp. PAMC 26621 TaxID=1112213 RepID=UPI000289172F|nr:histidine kinase [Sphingomonas sp. PAMC 26621]